MYIYMDITMITVCIDILIVYLDSIIRNGWKSQSNDVLSYKTHSTNLALLEITEQRYANLDVDNYGLGIYLEYQKAFDTVNHEILLHIIAVCVVTSRLVLKLLREPQVIHFY